jgi:exonuclease VII large subunit
MKEEFAMPKVKTKTDQIKELKKKVASLQKELSDQKPQSFEKTVHHVLEVLSKKATAKIRALEKAENEFEKKYAKKMGKHLPALFRRKK